MGQAIENQQKILRSAHVGSARLPNKSIAYEDLGWPWGSLNSIDVKF